MNGTEESVPAHSIDLAVRLIYSRERSKVAKLEGEFGGQLNAARSSTAKEWIADANVAGGGNVVPRIRGDI